MASLPAGAGENCFETDGCTRVAGVGHGILPPDEQMPMVQRQLLAIRAAKVDALRSIAEQVAGMRVQSSSSLDSSRLSSDRAETSVDVVLRGVRYIRVEPIQQGIYQAVAELDIYR